VAGLAGGFALLPRVIWSAFAMAFHLPNFVAQFNWSFALIATTLAMVCTLAATVFACRNALKEKPATLMLPRAPKAGKRIFLERIQFIWSKMKFSHKATARNLVRYKKHFFMAVTGIAGCTALILTAFGLGDSIGGIANKQFGKIVQYDLVIGREEPAGTAAASAARLDGFLQDPVKVASYTALSSETGRARHNGENIGVSIDVPDDPAQFKDYIHLNKRIGGARIDLADSAVVMTEKLAGALGIHPGDTFTLENAAGKSADIVLTGITENYIGSYIYIHPAEYARVFGEIQFFNRLLVKTNITDPAEQDQALRVILASDHVISAEFTSQTRKAYDKLLASIGFVVVILILAAGALAIIVLYNLTNINIEERRKELATLRVLGFHNKEVGGYIFRESAILTLIGTATGLALGVLLHAFVISIAENTDLMFGRGISALSFILSALLTFLFSFAVNLLMLRKLKKIEMAESMKTID
jgi:putative ABC transport system permease protein